jgi:outer membrane protein
VNRYVVAALVLAAAFPATAREAGDILLRAGAHTVQPKSDNGTISALAADVEVDGATMFTFNLTYMMTSNIGIELLAAAPFKHDIDIAGTQLGVTKHLPPTLSVIYAFNPGSKVTVYAGVGLNATLFFEEDLKGPLDAVNLSLENSWGPAALVGLDIALDHNWFINADVRYFDIDTKAKITAPGLSLKETVEIDPWAVGVNVGYRF